MRIETVINKCESFIKNSFKEEWPTMGNHLASCGVAISSASSFSHYAEKIIESDATISSLATIIDLGSYWGSLIGQFVYRDRNKYRNEDGTLNKNKIKKDIIGYGSMAGFAEVVYVISRTYGQYYLQKKGYDPGTAAFTVQMIASGIFTFIWPLARYGLRQWSEK